MERETSRWPGNTLTQLAASPTDQMEVKTFAAMTETHHNAPFMLLSPCFGDAVGWGALLATYLNIMNTTSATRSPPPFSLTWGLIHGFRGSLSSKVFSYGRWPLRTLVLHILFLQTGILRSITQHNHCSYPVGLGLWGSRGLRNSPWRRGFWQIDLWRANMTLSHT